MLLNSYILYKENNPADSKPMTRLEFNIKIVESLGEEWFREKKNVPTAGPSDEGQNQGKHLRKLPPGKVKNCCVCSKSTKLGKGARRRSRTICVKCEKGLHGECFPEHKCTTGT
jgi:hypothetical protein